MIGWMRRFDAGAYIDERNSLARGIIREVCSTPQLRPAPAIRQDFCAPAPPPVMAVDPNLSFPHKGRNSDKSGFSTRLCNDGMESKSMDTRGFYLGAPLLIVLSVFGVSGAAAQGTPEQQEACKPDVFRLCGNFIPNVEPIIACLKANEPNLSPACHEVMFPYVPEPPKPKAKAKGKAKPKKKQG